MEDWLLHQAVEMLNITLVVEVFVKRFFEVCHLLIAYSLERVNILLLYLPTHLIDQQRALYRVVTVDKRMIFGTIDLKYQME